MKNIIITTLSIMILSCTIPKTAYRPSYESPVSIRGGTTDEKMLIISGVAKKEDQSQPASSSERLLQYSAIVNMDTKNADSLFKRILVLTTKNNGYMLQSEKDRLVVRIPSLQFVPFLSSLDSLGSVVTKDIQGSDVTEEFFDLTTRLDNAQKSRLRYLELLNKAQNIEQALSVERELERLNRDIDLLSGKINKLKHLADYSTVTITTTAPVRPGPLGYILYGIYSAIKWLFVWD